jgi:hypothetical protein
MTALLASHREGHKTGAVVNIGTHKSFSPQGSEGAKMLTEPSTSLDGTEMASRSVVLTNVRQH